MICSGIKKLAMTKASVAAVGVVVLAFAGWAFHRQSVLDHGQQAFERLGCASCHFAGGGPNLSNLSEKYDAKTIVEFIDDPEAVYKRRGRKPVTYGYVGMHKVPGARPGDIQDIATYLVSLER
jgi:mono/diheme cytochrome c family protein